MLKKIINVILVFALVMCISSFFEKEEITTKSVIYNGNKLRVSIDGVVASTLPVEGNYYLVDYDCSNVNTKVFWNKENYTLSVSNGNKKGGVSCHLDFQSNPKLSDMPVGSYVKYTGNNGCSGNSCLGQNANYVNDNDMGYCGSSTLPYKYYANGWRIAYISNRNAHLISGGATDCMCTDSKGLLSSKGCTSNLDEANINKHFDNMNKVALNYCNTEFAKDGICDKTTTWAINNDDFSKIVKNKKDLTICYGNASNNSCGYTNDLIDNGGHYWFGNSATNPGNGIYRFIADDRFIGYDYSSSISGIRPVIAIDYNVVVTGGTGTYEEPYTIDNNTFYIKVVNDNEEESNVNNVELTLKGVNAAKMCISVNTSVCTNYIDFDTKYKLEFPKNDVEEKLIYVYYKNEKGYVFASMNKTIKLN